MTKATFQNIGPIEKANLELGDLTVIAGQNNTGKTYLVYTLYGFLSMFKKPGRLLIELNDDSFLFAVARKIVDKITKVGVYELDMGTYEEIKCRIVKAESSLFSSGVLSHIFNSPSGEFENSNFVMELKHVNSKNKFSVRVRSKETGDATYLKSYFEDRKLIFELDNSEDANIPIHSLNNGMIVLIRKIMQEECPDPFILSAERFGISLFYKELDFTKNRLVEELQKLSSTKRADPFILLASESARYAQPIKDNIDFTRDLPQIQKRKSKLSKEKIRSVGAMMDGDYKARSDEIRFVSKRRGANRFDIPLHLASSSARGVSDLYFYLKHVASAGQILIIDEPESHLSPTNQVLMARLLVFCVNSGLKVLITTHSDYLIKEINNLIALSGNFEGKDAFLRKNKKDYTDRDYLKPEAVKAYICKDGGLTSCTVDKSGIDMPVFDDAIDAINAISNELALLTNPTE